jgi:hypothetical protein
MHCAVGGKRDAGLFELKATPRAIIYTSLIQCSKISHSLSVLSYLLLNPFIIATVNLDAIQFYSPFSQPSSIGTKCTVSRIDLPS